MIGDVLLVGNLAVAVLGVLQRPGVAPGTAGEPRAETAIRDALRGDEAAAVRAEFRRRGVQGPEPRVEAAPFGWL